MLNMSLKLLWKDLLQDYKTSVYEYLNYYFICKLHRLFLSKITAHDII